MIRQLQPWHANLRKAAGEGAQNLFARLGTPASPAGHQSEKDLLNHPQCGASWEGYVIEEVLKTVEPEEAFFWATHGGAEIDLVLHNDGRWLGVECKRLDGPRLTPSMRVALEDLKLEQIAVVYPGTKHYPIAEAVHAVPWQAIAAGFEGLFPQK